MCIENIFFWDNSKYFEMSLQYFEEKISFSQYLFIFLSQYYARKCLVCISPKSNFFLSYPRDHLTKPAQFDWRWLWRCRIRRFRLFDQFSTEFCRKCSTIVIRRCHRHNRLTDFDLYCSPKFSKSNRCHKKEGYNVNVLKNGCWKMI